MELGGSFLYLARNEDEENQMRKKKISISSITSYYSQKNSIKRYFPQVLAATLSGLMHVAVGMTMTFSAVLIGQITKPSSDLKITKSDQTWIASVLMLATPVGSITGGIIMDKIGRLNTVKCTIVPLCAGWILLATAQNVPMIIIGRILGGFAGAWGANPAVVFITEISSPEIRSSLVSIAASFANLGMALSYIIGWFLPWRLFAWLANIMPVVSFVGLLFIPESPEWLIERGRITAAKKSLQWYYKHFPNTSKNGLTVAESKLESLIKKSADKKKEQAGKNRGGVGIFLHNFLRPTGYKPFLVFLGLFLFQQLSGIFVILFYAVSFNKDVGTKMDPYLVSTISGFSRFGVSVILLVLLKKFSRRGLLITSSLCMSFFMGISAYFTSYMRNHDGSFDWVPTVCNFLFFASSAFGLSSLPWGLAAEMFPLEIRGVAHSFLMSAAHFLMFVAVKSYFIFHKLLGGVIGMQYFFSIVCIVSAIYIYVFIPETKDKKLSEIEEYFSRFTVYLGNNNLKGGSKPNVAKNRAETIDFVKINDDSELKEKIELSA